MKATVFGAGGFVGRHLVAHLARQGADVRPVLRGDESWRGVSLGHVFYCIGLTADFRRRPLAAMEAHVGHLVDVLEAADFTSFLYLSSTRLYRNADSGAETARICVDPSDADDVYTLSKLAGEAACLALPRPEIRVARLSNIFGSGLQAENFLSSLRRSGSEGRLVLGQPLDSAKDYLPIADAVAALAAIAAGGHERIYNVAAGRQLSHAEVIASLTAACPCTVEIAAASTPVGFPQLDVTRLRALGIAAPVALEASLQAFFAAGV